MQGTSTGRASGPLERMAARSGIRSPASSVVMLPWGMIGVPRDSGAGASLVSSACARLSRLTTSLAGPLA